MTKDEFKILVKAMKAVYAQPTFLPDQDAFNVWYALLKDLPYQQATIAVQKYMVSEKFPPTIADIREKASELVSEVDDSMSEIQAWNLVHKAICNSGYHAEEEFEKLPIACQKAIGSPAYLREVCMLPSDEVATVVQSHFVRNYRTQVKRMKEDAKLPASMVTAIEQMRNSDGALEMNATELMEVANGTE